jgi:porphobilinogen synthase
MIAENSVTANDLLAPLFLIEGTKKKIAIDSMPGQHRYSLDLLVDHIKELEDHALKSIVVFPAIDDSLKTSDARESYNPESLYIKALRKIKQECPNIALMTDIALDPYSRDGHDGIVRDGRILNDETLDVLGKMALVQADAGADILGPSDMMDGRVAHIRSVLEIYNVLLS